jgi:putative Holliday junction resolvase
MSNELPPEGRIAGIDFGTIRIGVAISDPSREIASPLHTYTRQTEDLDAAHFRQLIDDQQIVGLVIGLPIHMSGEESAKSHEARVFGSWLAETTGLPICFYDERFSTAAADELLAAGDLTSKQRKKRRDMLAAQVILASYLDSDRASSRAQPLDDLP